MARLRPLFLLGLLLLGCSGDGNAVALPSDPASFYARLEGALRREGAVARIAITTSGSVDANPYATQETLWLDLEHGRARSELTTGFASAGAARARVRIVEGRALYDAPDGSAAARMEAPVCRGAPSAAVALLLACHGHLEVATVRVEASSFDRRPTVALVAEGSAPRSEEVRGFTDVLHLDAETMLPAGRTSAGSYDFGGVHAFDTRSSFDVRFERAGAMLPGAFDPSSLGHGARDLAAELDLAAAAVELHWPGARVELAGLPPLALATVFVADDASQPWVGARVVLGYRDATDEFAEPSVFVRSWRMAEWRGAASGSRHRSMGEAVIDVRADGASAYAEEGAAEALLAAMVQYGE